MTGQPFKKVFSGEKLNIPAKLWNVLVDVATEANAQGMDGGGDARFDFSRGVVRIQNTSTSSNFDRLSVLGISGVAISHADNDLLFLAQPILTGVTPTTASHVGKFVVTVDPLAPGGIGRAFAFGVFPVQVNMVSGTDTLADVKNGDATMLQSSSTSGAAQILWVESGTGSKWAVVRLGGGASSASAISDAMFPVGVTKTSGTAGDASTAASFVYTVTDPFTGGTLGTGLSPAWNRPIGKTLEADHGTGYYDPGSSIFVLYQVDEQPSTTPRDCG